jgi:hypothetical protein
MALLRDGFAAIGLRLYDNPSQRPMNPTCEGEIPQQPDLIVEDFPVPVAAI